MGRKPIKKSTKKKSSIKASQKEQCYYCKKALVSSDRVLFVEEEIGRTFCSEDCISQYFAPEIASLEAEYFEHLPSKDLSSEERENLTHLRWVTLEEPDETYRQKTASGDYRYTLISQFQPGNRPVWCVCVCLFLRGEPSFLYISFPTASKELVERFRKGELVVRESAGAPVAHDSERVANEGPTDRVAESWTDDDTLRAQMHGERKKSDIQEDEFGAYDGCVEQTLSEPDEVWTHAQEGLKTYHFIARFENEGQEFWYLVSARETGNPVNENESMENPSESQEEIEILDAFPTRDSALVDSFRVGKQEIGAPEDISEETVSARVIH